MADKGKGCGSKKEKKQAKSPKGKTEAKPKW